MKPEEFWQLEYRELVLYCNARIKEKSDQFADQVILAEATANKILQSNPYIVKKPKQLSLLEIFETLFSREM